MAGDGYARVGYAAPMLVETVVDGRCGSETVVSCETDIDNVRAAVRANVSYPASPVHMSRSEHRNMFSQDCLPSDTISL